VRRARQTDNRKSGNRYYEVMLGPLQQLARAMPSRRCRRIVVIRTTWEKFTAATEINDLFDESPLEDRLWKELKRLELLPERQDFVNGKDYALDFAFYCVKGKLDVETDGDRWHADRARIPEDNRRDNDLEVGGWKLLRFNSQALNEQMTNTVFPTIIDTVKRLGGIDEGRVVPRDITAEPSQPKQIGFRASVFGFSKTRQVESCRNFCPLVSTHVHCCPLVSTAVTFIFRPAHFPKQRMV
jgi:very-short-patch-repair endonuclease